MKITVRLVSSVLLIYLAIVQPTWSAESAERRMAGAGHFSEDVFNMLFSHPVSDSRQVREPIKRAITSGTGQTEGNVGIDLVPDESRGRMDFWLRASVNIEDATTTQGQIRLRSNVRSQVFARKTVFFEPDGLHDLPATAHCPTNIQIRQVHANRPLIARFAGRRAQRGLGEVEGIVSQRTSRQFKERLDKRIGTAMQSFDERLRSQLRFDEAGFNFLPPEATFASTDQHLQFWISPRQDQAPTAPPQEGYLDPALDIHVVVFEDVFSELAEDRLAGRRMQDDQILKAVEAFRGSAPWSLWVHARRPRWSFQLAETGTLKVQIADGNIRAWARLAEFRYGPDVLNGPIVVELTLRPEITDDGPRLHRVAGPTVSLEHTPPESLSAQQTRLVDLLHQKFEGIFPPDAYFDSMQPPAGGSWDKVRSLTLTRLNAEQRWFEVGFQFQPEPTLAQLSHAD